MRPPRLIFSGGGTGGHLYPALAVAEEIRRRVADAEISFVGTRKRIEARVVPEHGFPLETIWIS
jgi:UDP-N-acetylglucosamine--N-acetylmuramyl-(pentapeptide) pyrophosphoryl-undecaprenol N-acetylglucosamine transferase